MATARQTAAPATPRNSRRALAALIISLLAVPNSLTGGGLAAATCGVEFLFPTGTPVFFSFRDTINVTYRSQIADPALSCWCGGDPETATLKFRIDNVSPFNGSALVHLNFVSDDPCWFDLSSVSGHCGDVSETFILSSNRRAPDGVLNAAADAPASSPTAPAPERRLARFQTSSKSTTCTVATLESRDSGPGEDRIGPGAKAALGIGIALISIALGAMASFLYFRRRRRGQDSELSGAIMDHARQQGKRQEKNRFGAPSSTSGRSDEPLNPIQPVFDGYPGSTGYDDVRSLRSYSPPSPTLAYNGGFPTCERSIEREELIAARLRSRLQTATPTVVSYGPNPVTPTLIPRNTSTSGEDVGPRATPVSDYTNYSTPPPVSVSEPGPPAPRQPAAPLVVSYGPNKVTPTPKVESPTVPPDEAIVSRRFKEAGSASSHERQFSWEADSPLLGASMGPLPPYASTEEFEAMEKGAVRKLAEPQAEAELPPTKDGFYHYTSEIVEHELPGAAPQREPQLPFRLFKIHPQAGSSGGGGRWEVEEQKFLLSDAEISKMRAEKAKARAPAPKAEEESYDLGEPANLR